MKWILGAGVLAAAMLAGCGGGDAGPETPAASVVKTAASAGESAAPGIATLQKAATPMPGDVVANGGFESGTSGWTVASGSGMPLVGTFQDVAANTGAQMAWLGGGDDFTDRIAQAVTVPSGGQARLQFWYRIASSDSEVTAYDKLSVEVYSTGGNRLATLATLSNLDRTNGWVKSAMLDLSAYQGQSVEIRFTADLDISEPTSFMIDDVSVFPLGATGIVPVTGVWWNPAENGSGYIIDRFGSQVYLSAYLYEESGAPTWYTSLLSPQADGSYTGVFTRYSGGQSLLGAYRAPTGTTEVAQVNLSFATATTATLRVQKAGSSVTRSTPIELFTLGTAASAASFQPGVWWNEAESGRGFVLQVYGSTVVMSSFMFDTAGEPVWYLGTAQLSGSGGFTMQLQQYHGGQSLGGSYRPATPQAGSPGQLVFVATTATTGRLTLPNGRTIDVKRFDLGGGSSNPGGGGTPPPSGGTPPPTGGTPPPTTHPGTPPAATTYTLSTSVTGSGRGAVSPAGGTFAAGQVITVNPQPHFWSEFHSWTSAPGFCQGQPYACEVTMDGNKSMQARFEPAVFATTYDTQGYTNHLTTGCQWTVVHSNTRARLTFVYSGTTVTAKLRLTGRRTATVAREFNGTNCNGSDRNYDVTADVPVSEEGMAAQVRVFDGSGDEYVTIRTFGHMPGPRIGDFNGFVPVQIDLTYSGTNRNGGTSLMTTLQRGAQ